MFWDQVAGVYDIFVNVINRKTHKILKEIVSDLIEPDDVVLECACGTGLLSAVIAKKCRRLTATDFSGEMLKNAEKNCTAFQNITFAKADITALAFPDCSFDKVVAGNVIHLLDNPLTALGELNRVCKDGGMLIIPTYMNKDSKGKTSGFAATVGKAGADRLWEKPGLISNDSLLWTVTDSFFWTRGIQMCRSYWPTDAFPALLPL